MVLTDRKELVRRWSRGSFDTRADSIRYHHARHARGQTVWEYLQAAADFDVTRASVRVRSDGTLSLKNRRHEFLVTMDSLIVSYGLNDIL